jgi:hypothetical protein
MSVWHFLWMMEPPHAQLFYAVLAVVCIVSLAQATLLSVAVFGLPRLKRRSREALGAEERAAVDLAAAGLAGRIGQDGRRFLGSVPARTEWERVLREADAHFSFEWQMAYARVSATREFAKLAVLLSVLVVSFGAYSTLFLSIYEINIPVATALLRGLRVLMTRLTIGLAVSIALCAMAMVFNGRLIRRKASWGLFRATAADPTRI